MQGGTQHRRADGIATQWQFAFVLLNRNGTMTPAEHLRLRQLGVEESRKQVGHASRKKREGSVMGRTRHMLDTIDAPPEPDDELAKLRGRYALYTESFARYAAALAEQLARGGELEVCLVEASDGRLIDPAHAWKQDKVSEPLTCSPSTLHMARVAARRAPRVSFCGRHDRRTRSGSSCTLACSCFPWCAAARAPAWAGHAPVAARAAREDDRSPPHPSLRAP